MSASTVNNAAQGAAPSTFENFKNGAFEVVNWMGRQIQWLASTIKHYAVKAYEYVKPFFESIGRVIGDGYAKVRDFAVANKEVSITIGVLVALISAIGLGTWMMQKSDEKPAEAPKANA